ncbi:hypothetical protein [Kordia sp.]|uniref:hypothetical protein n=1 Tax=Kordia sp. TaxID=1965332 RepID=UPI003D2B0117
MQKKKNTLEISDSFKGETVEEIAGKLPKKQHAFLIVNNNEVLSKHIKSNEKESNRLLFNAFPSVSLNEFYYEINSNQNYHTISICRKSIVDKFIDEYKKHHISIIGFSLGNTNVSLVNSLIDNATYYTSNALITKENDVITEIQLFEETPKQSYEINGLRIQNTQLLAFSGALSFITQTKEAVSNFEEKELSLLQNFKQQRFFSQFLLSGLGFVLMILLVNFFVFSSYYTEVEMLKETSQVNVIKKDKLLKLKVSTDEKQKMVDDILKNATSRSSYYIDKIALSLPNTIQLSELNYQPIVKRIKKEKPVELQKHTIVISGISTDSDLFLNWIHTLESFDWILHVTPINYGSTAKNSTNFGLKIQLSHE